jgi:hypothetical protein
MDRTISELAERETEIIEDGLTYFAGGMSAEVQWQKERMNDTEERS